MYTARLLTVGECLGVGSPGGVCMSKGYIQGSVCVQGCVPPVGGVRGVCPEGVHISPEPRGRHQPGCGQNDWKMPVKILPCPKLLLWAVTQQHYIRIVPAIFQLYVFYWSSLGVSFDGRRSKFSIEQVWTDLQTSVAEGGYIGPMSVKRGKGGG